MWLNDDNLRERPSVKGCGMVFTMIGLISTPSVAHLHNLQFDANSKLVYRPTQSDQHLEDCQELTLLLPKDSPIPTPFRARPP